MGGVSGGPQGTPRVPPSPTMGRPVWIDRDEAAALARILGTAKVRAATGTGPPLPPRTAELHLRLAMAAAGHDPHRPPQRGDMIDVTEAAKIIGRSPRHVRRLAPDLGATKTAGRWLFHRADVENLKIVTKGRPNGNRKRKR